MHRMLCTLRDYGSVPSRPAPPRPAPHDARQNPSHRGVAITSRNRTSSSWSTTPPLSSAPGASRPSPRRSWAAAWRCVRHQGRKCSRLFALFVATTAVRFEVCPPARVVTPDSVRRMRASGPAPPSESLGTDSWLGCLPSLPVSSTCTMRNVADCVWVYLRRGRPVPSVPETGVWRLSIGRCSLFSFVLVHALRAGEARAQAARMKP